LISAAVASSSLPRFRGSWICPRHIVLVVLGGSALLSLFNAFFLHITPDVSIYLLHARSFLETLSRFSVSHDSKGPLMSLLLAPAVALLGAGTVAAAVTQSVLYSVAVLLVFFVLRRHVGMWTGLIVGALWLTVAFAPRMMGGRMRPEDAGIVYVLVTLCAALRPSPLRFGLCGTMIACALLTKATLALTPALAALTGLALYFRSLRREGAGSGRIPWGGAGMLGAGFAAVAALVLGWLFVFDDIGAWYQQTIRWPYAYRSDWPLGGESGVGFQRTFALLERTGLVPLACGGILGLVRGAWQGRGRLVALLCAVCAGELARMTYEGALWPYLVTVMVPPAMIACALLGARRDEPSGSAWGWGVTLLLLAPMALSTAARQLDVLRMRVVGGLRSPAEHMAERMRAHYVPDESVLPLSNDVQLILRLGAPRPYPVLFHHLPLVSDEAKREAMGYYREHPPDWIIDAEPGRSAKTFLIVGKVDDLLYGYVPLATDDGLAARAGTLLVGDRFEPSPDSREYRHTLLSAHPYRLKVDLGWMQAWRRADREAATGFEDAVRPR